MRIDKIVFKIMLLTILIVICNSYMCYAGFEINDDLGGGGGTPNPSKDTSITVEGDTSKRYPTLDSNYKPGVEGSKVIEITNSILGVIMVIGVICIVVFIALTGFGTILGSASEKAELKSKFVGYIIAAILITSGATIAKLIISVAETLG